MKHLLAFLWLIGRMPIRALSLLKRIARSFRDRIAEYGFALIVYAGLVAISTACFLLIPLLWAKLVALAGLCLLLTLITTIRYRYGDVSEPNVAQLRNEKNNLEDKLRKAESHAIALEDRLKREKQSFFGMAWVWEITVAEALSEFRKTFDYYIGKGTKDLVPWNKKPKECQEGDKRAAGSMVIPYKASISIDLRQVRIQRDAKKKTALFAVPEPQIRVRQAGKSTTDELRLALEFHKPWLKDGLWVLDNEEERQLPVWEQETKQAFDAVLAADLTNTHLGEAVRMEAENRIASLLTLLTGYDAVATTEDQLDSPKFLSAVWENSVKSVSNSEDHDNVPAKDNG